MADAASRVPPALRAAYQRRCQDDGVPLAEFLDEARGTHEAEALVALVDEVEREVLENLAMMAQARPELEPVAAERAEAVRRELASLRAALEGGG